MFKGRFVGSRVGLLLSLPVVALSASAVDGVVDPDFGNSRVGMLVPDGSDVREMARSSAIALLDGLTEMTAVKDASNESFRYPTNDLRGDDRVFFTGFEVGTTTLQTIDFDDLVEGFEGASWTYAGIHFHDVNGIDAVFPDGSVVGAEELGDQLTIENASVFYDASNWGSWPNALTFGGAYINGNNFSVGPLARVTMDMEGVLESVGFDLAYYENVPWGNIELHLDAYLDGEVTGSDMLTIADDFRDRDNLATAHFSIEGVAFDSLKLYATYRGRPSAPRVMIDHLVTTMRSAGR